MLRARGNSWRLNVPNATLHSRVWQTLNESMVESRLAPEGAWLAATPLLLHFLSMAGSFPGQAAGSPPGHYLEPVLGAPSGAAQGWLATERSTKTSLDCLVGNPGAEGRRRGLWDHETGREVVNFFSGVWGGEGWHCLVTTAPAGIPSPRLCHASSRKSDPCATATIQQK